ncbi:hypothetical protein [Photobacterium kasasachensis]|uniref:hypothetical protein n=1 Tax=Photobacterium kasasachensis TaxID=2910240 RepID=UPI003D13EFCA
MTNNTYVIATIKPWNINHFHRIKDTLPGTWHLITSKDMLTTEWLSTINPRYIFFPHWSWIVPEEVLNRWECVCFHMADVPYGRGGSPLQNLVERGHSDTKVSALRMVKELDAGPVYKKLDLSLAGSAQDIFERMVPKVYDLIRYIASDEPMPQAQMGEGCTFRRRTPEQSQLPVSGETEELYNHIRMLDAETYPKAFLDNGDFRLEFDKAYLDSDGKVVARVIISQK